MKNKKLLCPRGYITFPRGYITITCLHKSAGWSVGTNQNHSAKNKINTSGGTGDYLKPKTIK